MNILNFEKWIMNINEGFNADINSIDNDSKDEMEIEAPNEGNNIIYVVDGDDVITKKEKIVNKDDDENTIDHTYSDIEKIEDVKLKKDVINAVDAINDIKDRERSNEIFRLTGGDDTNIKKEIIKIFDDPNSKKIRKKQTTKNGETIEYSLFKLIQKESNNDFWNNIGSYYYLDLSKLNKEYDIKDMYSKIIKTVGKGEYLLPLLYHDVYKQQVYGYNKYDLDTFSIGDNFILRNENGKDEKYHLELKAPNASLTFKDINDIKKYKNNNREIDDNYKSIIASSFIKYANRQNKNRKKLYMGIFNEDNNGNPLGILFINISNISNIKDDERKLLLDNFKNLIYIDTTDTSSKKDFKYTVIYNKNVPKIKCNLHKSYLSKKINDAIQNSRKEKRTEKKKQKTINNESKILSRDNFINEIYKK